MEEGTSPELKRRAMLAATGGGVLLAGLPWSGPARGSKMLEGGIKDAKPPRRGSGALEGLHGYTVASAQASEGSGTPDDPWRLSDIIVDDAGPVVFDAGTFLGDEIRTPPDLDYERWSVWFQGAGTRTTSVQKLPEDGHLLSFEADDAGNFGGARGMGIYGTYPDESLRSEGNLIHSTGDIIDLIFRDLIVRYGWGDGIHIESSSSGTRIHNCWIENSAGWAVYLGGGTRAKLSNLHIITCFDGGIYVGNSNAQVSNVSLYNVLPGLVMDCSNTQVSNVQVTGADFDGVAVDETENSAGNAYSNVNIADVTTGVVLRGTDSHVTNSIVRETAEEALWLAGDGTSAQGVSVKNFSRDGGAAVKISGDQCRVSGLTVRQEAEGYDSDVLARITGDRAHLADVSAEPGQDIRIDDATETVISGVSGLRTNDIVDDGDRTLINGTGTNDGDPGERGEWKGHADYAHAMDATIWDTSTTPWTAYRADGQGNWV